MPIIKVKLEKIYPNPYQPKSRVEVSEEDARKFGESILTHGMILTPVGRRTNGVFEMGDGWLRLAGHRWLVNHGHPEFQDIIFDERPLSDQQMADLVIEANKTRKDLNPIEEAGFYSKYLKEFDITQEDLAKKYGISQGEVANTLRLLDLPENVQQKVISQEISATHARQLLRLNIDHEVQSKYMDTTIKHNWSVSQLDNQINRLLWQNSKPLNQVNDRFKEGALFDVKDCEKCENTAIVANPWGETKKTRRCLDIACWEKKQKAAEKALEDAAKKKLEKKAAGQKVLTNKDVGSNDYESLKKSEIDTPSECDKCSKRALYSYRDDGSEPHAICTDKKCYRAKKTKHTKAENKSKKEQEQALTSRLAQIFEKTSKNRYACLVVAARYMARRIDSNVRDKIAGMFDNVPKHSNGKLDPDALAAKLINMPEPEIVKLLNAMVISAMRFKDTWTFSTELKEDVLMDIAILEGTYEAKAAEVKAFQEANCDGCGNANKSLVHTGENCCTFSHNKKVKDGICQNSPNKDRKAPATTAGAPVYKLVKRGTGWIALDETGLVIAMADDKERANARAVDYFRPVVTVLNPSTDEYMLNHTYRIIPRPNCGKHKLENGYDITDVKAQDLATAAKALLLSSHEIKEIKVFKSSGKIGTCGDVSAGWSKCTEQVGETGGKKPVVDDLVPPQFPPGVRSATAVPDIECKDCPLAPEDHTLGHKFLKGNVSHKVCIKDYCAWEKTQESAGVAT